MANYRAKLSKGFTLVELLVVVLIIGILAAIGIPQYQKTIETSYADDAVATMNSIGSANRMYALDNGGTLLNGQFPSGVCDSNTADCTPANCPSNGACCLITCGYMASQNFASKAYTFYAGSGSGCGSGTIVASANRCTGAKSPCNGSGVYANWAYSVDNNGVVASCPAPGQSGAAPTPAQ